MAKNSSGITRNWKPIISMGVVAVILIGVFLFVNSKFSSTGEDTLYIAVVAPGKDSLDGQDTINGVRLLLDEINADGGIQGKSVDMLVLDDENNSQKAYDLAIDIVEKNQALAVIGHAQSGTSQRAGKIYNRFQIPTITGSATAGGVTADNPWYFRVIPNSQSQSSFLASYVMDIMGQETATVVYDQDAFGTTLKDPFIGTFQGLGGEVKAVYGFDGDAADLDQRLDAIVDQLRQDPDGDPGAIYLAVHAPEGVKLIVAMKRKGLDVPIYGPSAFTNIDFLARFEAYPEEQAQPGFFSDGVFTIAPVVYDVASKTGQTFRINYLAYLDAQEVPTENADAFPGMKGATNYDAAKVLIKAMRAADIAGEPGTRDADRQKIREALASISSLDKAVDGVTGKIFFDQNGDVVKPVSMGVFQHGRLISAMKQLQPVVDIHRINDLQAALETGEILIVDGQYMHKTSVAYTGIDFIEVSNLNVKNGTYTMDFYLWFRYPEGANADDIEFLNEAKDISLGQPLDRFLENGVQYRTYRVKGDFSGDFYFENYPFDHQKLTVKFRHATATRNDLIFARDNLGMDWTTVEHQLEKLRRTDAFGEEGTWRLGGVNIYPDTLESESTLGNPNYYGTESNIGYSRFNAEIEIQREAMKFVVKNMLPLVAVAILAYLSIFLPPEQYAIKNAIDRGALLTVAFFHIKLSNDLPGIGYTVALDWVFYAMYALIVGNLIISAIIRDRNQKEKFLQVKTLTLFGKIIYPSILIGLMMLFAFKYELIYLPAFPIRSQTTAGLEEATEAISPSTTDTEEVILRLGSWRTDDQKQMEIILAAFNQAHPGITVKFEPIVDTVYADVLQVSLDSGNAPDLFYAYPFEFMEPLINANHVAPLQDISDLHENFDPAILAAWSGEEGTPYAVPMMAVSYAVYYNTDLFAQLGLQTPTTWEELLAAADTIQTARYLPFANGSKDPQTVEDIIFKGTLLPNFIGGEEGRLAYLDGTRCFNDAQMLSAFKAVDQIAPLLSPFQSTYSYYDAQQNFRRGYAAMLIDGSWAIAAHEEAELDFNWSIFPMPAPEKQASILTVNPDFGVALNASTAHPEEARQFLAWLMTPEALTLYQDHLPGFFALHNQSPAPKNTQAQIFFQARQAQPTDMLWDLPSGLPDGNTIMQQGAVDIINGDSTPRQVTYTLQRGMAQWFGPAQTCGSK